MTRGLVIARLVAPGADIGVDCELETVYVKKDCIECIVLYARYGPGLIIRCKWHAAFDGLGQ